MFALDQHGAYQLAHEHNTCQIFLINNPAYLIIELERADDFDIFNDLLVRQGRNHEVLQFLDV